MSMQLHTQARAKKMRAGLIRGTLGRDAEEVRGRACEGTHAITLARPVRIAFTLLEMLGERTNINKFWGFCVLAPIL